MLERAHALAAILERMLALYERVHDILVRERRALVEFDFEFLLVIVREKDEVLSTIKALDRDRLRIQDHFSLVMDKPSDQLTLRFLGSALVEQGSDAEVLGRRLLTLRQHLSARMEAVRGTIDSNKIFIEKSVHNLQMIASHVTQLVSGQKPKGKKGSAVYNKKAKSSLEVAESGSLVEKRY